MSDLFNNFINGFAFGMYANNPFFCCMPNWWGGGFLNNYIVDFGTFANPFPRVQNENYSMQTSIFSMSGTPFPAVDYSGVCRDIWDTFTNPDSDYNKNMRDFYEYMQKQQSSDSSNDNNQTYIPQIQFPFSSFYMPTQITMNPFVSGYYGSQQLSNNNQSSRRTDYTGTREFEQAYKSLGITDKRFQKIFEECILKNEGKIPNEDLIIKKDVHSKNKNGVLQGTYDDYRDKKGLAHQDVENMTAKEMCEIYYNIYVDSGASKISDDGLALYVFDSDVNMGADTGKKILEKSGNNAGKFEEERRKEYATRSNFNTYKDGWYNRIDNTRKYADSNLSV